MANGRFDQFIERQEADVHFGQRIWRRIRLGILHDSQSSRESDVVWLAKTFVSNKHRKNNKILPATLFFSAENKLRIAGLNEAQIGSVRNILDVCGLKIQGEDGYMGDFLRM